MMKSYRIRIYPTKEQENNLWKHINACRYIWNYMLNYQEQNYKKGGKHLSAFSMINLLKPLKNDGEHDWLYEVSNTSLQRRCQDLANAYDLYFTRKAKRPNFKTRKKSKSSFPVCSEKFYLCDDKLLTIQKIGKVKYKTDYKLPIGIRSAKFINVRVSYIHKKWIVSFSLECENQAPVLTDISMGIDLGIKNLATVEFGGKQIIFPNINKSQKIRLLKKRIAHTQRVIFRKYEQNKKDQT